MVSMLEIMKSDVNAWFLSRFSLVQQLMVRRSIAGRRRMTSLVSETSSGLQYRSPMRDRVRREGGGGDRRNHADMEDM